jgi:hypothetical protein
MVMIADFEAGAALSAVHASETTIMTRAGATLATPVAPRPLSSSQTAILTLTHLLCAPTGTGQPPARTPGDQRKEAVPAGSQSKRGRPSTSAAPSYGLTCYSGLDALVARKSSLCNSPRTQMKGGRL